MGAWAREEQLYRETLDWLPDQNGRETAAAYHQLGNIAYLRGDFERALEYYQRSLAIFQELGDRAGVSISFHQLGMIAQERGDYERALEYYQQSLTIKQELGDRAGTSSSYHQLGMIAQERGDYEQALEYYQQSLTIGQELGDRAGIATATGQVGVLYTQTDRAGEAVAHSLTALTIHSQIGAPEVRIDLYWLARQRSELGTVEFNRILTEHLDPESIINLTQMLKRSTNNQRLNLVPLEYWARR